MIYSSATYTVSNPPANAGQIREADLIPGLGRFPGVGIGNPLQWSCLENSMDTGAWPATVLRGLQGVQFDKSDLTHAYILGSVF